MVLRLTCLVLLMSFLHAGVAIAKKKTQVSVPPISVVELADRMTLVHIHQPDQGTVSARYVVRAGSFEDPAQKGGLAHLLEHLIFHGSYDIEEGEIFRQARAAGATVNAYTGTSWTLYALDAPQKGASDLLSLYLRNITNPAIQLADIARERQVVDAEHFDFATKSLLWAFDQQVFPSANRGQTIAGTPASRANIEEADLSAFFERHYTPRNTVVVVVGDLSLSEVRALVEGAVLIPPAPLVASRVDAPVPNVPSSSRILAWPTSLVVGYHVGDTSERDCRDLAMLVDLRVAEQTRLAEPLASESQVVCHESRGTRFVLALLRSKTLSSSRLPDLVDDVFRRVRHTPPTLRERNIIQDRHTAQMRLLLAGPASLAQAVAEVAATARADLEERVEALFQPPTLKASSLRQVAAQYIDEAHQVRLQFSPYAHD